MELVICSARPMSSILRYEMRPTWSVLLINRFISLFGGIPLWRHWHQLTFIINCLSRRWMRDLDRLYVSLAAYLFNCSHHTKLGIERDISVPCLTLWSVPSISLISDPPNYCTLTVSIRRIREIIVHHQMETIQSPILIESPDLHPLSVSFITKSRSANGVAPLDHRWSSCQNENIHQQLIKFECWLAVKWRAFFGRIGYLSWSIEFHNRIWSGQMTLLMTM